MSDTTEELPPGSAPHADEDENLDTRTEVYWPEGKQTAVAKALTDAADEHDVDQAAVQLHGDHFVVPAELADKAKSGLDAAASDDSVDEDNPVKRNIKMLADLDPTKTPAKKAPAKKSTAKN